MGMPVLLYLDAVLMDRHVLEESPPEALARFDAERVRALVEPLVLGCGFGLWDIEWTGSILRVFIEHPAQLEDPLAGVTLEDCVQVSRAVSLVLDETAELVPGAYHLEVSSPGLDKPLRSASDFKRQVGRSAKCKLKAAASDGQLALRGTILSASDVSIEMEVDGNRFTVLLDNIREAKLVFDVGTGKQISPQKKVSKDPKQKRSHASPRIRS